MSLFITNKDIAKFHVYFDEIGYHENNELDWEKFMEAAVDKLNHTVDFDGATWAASLIRECVQKWDTLEKIFEKKKDIWNQYDWGMSKEIPRCKKKDAEGVCYLTNIFSDDAKDFVFSSHDFGVDWNEIEFDGENYMMADSNFFMSEDPENSDYMDLYNQKGKIVCSIGQTDERLVLVDNKTTFEMQESLEGPIIVLPKAYYNSLKEGQSIDAEQVILEFETRWIDEEYKYAVTKFTVYQAVIDLDIPQFIAAAEIVLANNVYKDLKRLKKKSVFDSIFTIAALNAIRPR